MPLYVSYANKEDLATYLGVEQENLPSDAERLLARASELIEQYVKHNFDFLNDNHIETVKLAACAQVEYWLQISEGAAIVGGIKQMNVGNATIEYEKLATLAPRTKQYLTTQGLLYCGI